MKICTFCPSFDRITTVFGTSEDDPLFILWNFADDHLFEIILQFRVHFCKTFITTIAFC